MFSKIVVGTDGSETAARAVARAVDLASGFDAELVVVNVHGPRDESRGRRVIEEVEKLHAGSARIRGVLRSGHPADALADVAEEEKADLIVVGNKGMTGVSRFLGSVPNSISHQAPTHVLIVRTT